MSPVIKKPAAKRKIVVKRTTSATAKKPVVKPAAKRVVKPAAKRVIKPVAKPIAKPAAKPVPKASAPAMPALLKPAALPPSLEGKTNQDIINVIYKAAEDLGMPAWTLLAKVKLEHLVDARGAPYTGPVVGDLPDLTPDQRSVIARTLISYVRPKK